MLGCLPWAVIGTFLNDFLAQVPHPPFASNLAYSTPRSYEITRPSTQPRAPPPRIAAPALSRAWPHAQDRGLGVHESTMVLTALNLGGCFGVLAGGLGAQAHPPPASPPRGDSV